MHEIDVGGRPYATLRLAKSGGFAPAEEALVEVLRVHATLALERVALKSRASTLARVRELVGEPDTRRAATMLRKVGDLQIDLGRHEVFVAGAAVHVTPSEFRLLALLAEQPGRAYTREEIVERLWNTSYAVSPRVADAHVARLRRKVERDPRHPERLEPVRGVGYRLVAPRRPTGSAGTDRAT